MLRKHGARYYDFEERKAFSKGDKQLRDMALIAEMIPDCTDVRVASFEMDRIGVDYIATIGRGTEVYVDAKTREVGCSRYWRYGPELALETISAEVDGVVQKVGWTLNPDTPVDMILFTFDPWDTHIAYLLPFQPLRAAFVKNREWWPFRYRVARQRSDGWFGECVFVPACVVEHEITTVCRRDSMR